MTEAQNRILRLFGERMRVKGEAGRRGRNCALACVIIRAETIECTQNAERGQPTQTTSTAFPDCVSQSLLWAIPKPSFRPSPSVQRNESNYVPESQSSAQMLLYHIHLLQKKRWNVLCPITGHTALRIYCWTEIHAALSRSH